MFRYYGKKRGHRRTGSNTLGSAGEAAFFAAFLLLGIGGLVLFFLFLVVPQWRVNQEFIESTCEVLDARVAENESDEGTLYRPEIRVSYRIDDKTYVRWTYDIGTALDAGTSYTSGREAKESLLGAFVVDRQQPRTYPCWYDPADPNVVVLVRGYSWWVWLIGVVPLAMILVGSGGVIYTVLHWGKSAERRAAMTQRAQQRDPFAANRDDRKEYPNIPTGANITNSPGTTLKFRLPIATSPGWALFGMMMLCLIWNALMSVFVTITIRGFLDGRPDWLLTAFVVPFGLVGIGLIVYFVRQLLVTTGIGPTTVEISDHPLIPGARCQLLVSQSGRLTVNSLKVLLVCEEEATFRQGTNTRTERWEVHRHEVFRREEFEVQHGLPFEAECELKIPEGVMHSFKAEHNGIIWKVVVQGDVLGWPDYERSFPVIIRPGNGEPAT